MQSDIDDQIQPTKEPGGLLKFIGILWGVHVLIAALLFPCFLLPGHNSEDPKNIQRERLYTGSHSFCFSIFCA
jgi:hypothetical protein